MLFRAPVYVILLSVNVEYVIRLVDVQLLCLPLCFSKNCATLHSYQEGEELPDLHIPVCTS